MLKIERSLMIDLKSNHLKKVKGILAGHVPEYDVLIYGSRADGSAKPRSYLDLAIITDTPLVARRLEDLSQAFAGAGFPFNVDTVDWAATGKDFRKEIKRTGVLIQHSHKK
jgi:predicted nucleotidyltransferase